MKKIVLLCLLHYCPAFFYGQDFTGQWNGALQLQGTRLRVVFHIIKTDTGWAATMDSPDQGAMGIPVTTTRMVKDSVDMVIASAAIHYQGVMTGTGQIQGDFIQGGNVFQMPLSRSTIDKQVRVHPQNPVAPYPYSSQDVTFVNMADSVTLAGTLTIPEGKGPYTAVILISGSGPQNRNEELLGHQPFLVLADYLTRKGIAVLRYDDRGTGASTGVFAGCTTADFARDAQAAFEYLKKRKEINTTQIGYLGHSEGGVIAPIVAAHSAQVDFIVLMAGTGIRGDSLLTLQQELVARSMGTSALEYQKIKPVNREMLQIAMRGNSTEQVKKELLALITQSAVKNPSVTQGMSVDDFCQTVLHQLTDPWMNYFLRYDPATALRKVRCPVLAINGSRDIQVPARENLEAIARALAAGGNHQVTTKEYPGLNHLFQQCTSCSVSEYETIKQTLSPEVLADIASWIAHHK